MTIFYPSAPAAHPFASVELTRYRKRRIEGTNSEIAIPSPPLTAPQTTVRTFRKVPVPRSTTKVGNGVKALQLSRLGIFSSPPIVPLPESTYSSSIPPQAKRPRIDEHPASALAADADPAAVTTAENDIDADAGAEEVSKQTRDEGASTTTGEGTFERAPSLDVPSELGDQANGVSGEARALSASTEVQRHQPRKSPSDSLDTWTIFADEQGAIFERRDLSFAFRPKASNPKEAAEQKAEWGCRIRTKPEIARAYDRLLAINADELDGYHFHLPSLAVFTELAPHLPEWLFKLDREGPTYCSPLDANLSSGEVRRLFRYTYLWTAECSLPVAREIAELFDEEAYDGLAAEKGCSAAFEDVKLGLEFRLAEAEAAEHPVMEIFKYIGWGATIETLPNRQCRALQHLDGPSSLFAVLLEVLRVAQARHGPDAVRIHLSFITALPFSLFPHGTETTMFSETILAIARRATPTNGAGNVLACGKVNAIPALRDYTLALDPNSPLDFLPPAVPSLRTIVLNGAARHGWSKVSEAVTHYLGQLGALLKSDPMAGSADTSNHESHVAAEQLRHAQALPSDLQLEHQEKVRRAGEEDTMRQAKDKVQFTDVIAAHPLSSLLKSQLPPRKQAFEKSHVQFEEERYCRERRERQMQLMEDDRSSSGSVDADSRTKPTTSPAESTIRAQYKIATAPISSLEQVLRTDFGYVHVADTLSPYQDSPKIYRSAFLRLAARRHAGRGNERRLATSDLLDNVITPMSLRSSEGCRIQVKVCSGIDQQGYERVYVVISATLIGSDGPVSDFLTAGGGIKVDLPANARTFLRLRFNQTDQTLELLTESGQIVRCKRGFARIWTLQDLRNNMHNLRAIAIALGLVHPRSP